MVATAAVADNKSHKKHTSKWKEKIVVLENRITEMDQDLAYLVENSIGLEDEVRNLEIRIDGLDVGELDSIIEQQRQIAEKASALETHLEQTQTELDGIDGRLMNVETTLAEGSSPSGRIGFALVDANGNAVGAVNGDVTYLKVDGYSQPVKFNPTRHGQPNTGEITVNAPSSTNVLYTESNCQGSPYSTFNSKVQQYRSELRVGADGTHYYTDQEAGQENIVVYSWYYQSVNRCINRLGDSFLASPLTPFELDIEMPVRVEWR